MQMKEPINRRHNCTVHSLQHTSRFPIDYLSSIFHIVLLAWTRSNTAGGGGAALFCAAEYDGVLIEVTCSLHSHRHRAALLAHIVAAESPQKRVYFKNAVFRQVF